MNVEDWVEYCALALFVLGFLLAFSSGSENLSYVFVVLVGLTFAHLWFRWRKNLKVILVFLMLAFLFGYVIGNFYGSRKLSAVLFLLALFAGYQLQARGWLKALEI